MTAVKHKVKYSVDYDSSTDTLSEKLNTLLDSIVTLIKTNNPSLIETSRITYGSSEMTGAPLFDGDTRFTYASLVKNGGRYQSDVIFLGLNKNNIVLSLCFIDNKLVIAMNMDPSVEKLYTDDWDNIKPTGSYSTLAASKPMIAVGMASRYTFYQGNQNEYNIFFPIIISNNKIEIHVVYWNGNNSNGYMFYDAERHTNEVDLVLYKTNNNGNASLGCALYRYSKIYNDYNNVKPQILAFSFDENLSENRISQRIPCVCPHGYNVYDSDYELYGLTSDNIIDNNSKYDLKLWFALPTQGQNYLGYLKKDSCLFMCKLHTLGYINAYKNAGYSVSMPIYDNVKTFTHEKANADQVVSPMCSAYSLPYLEDENEVYLRQVRVPGFIDNCYGELYMMWTPSIQSYKSGDIVEIDDDKYAVINEGVVCWVTKV